MYDSGVGAEGRWGQRWEEEKEEAEYLVDICCLDFFP